MQWVTRMAYLTAACCHNTFQELDTDSHSRSDVKRLVSEQAPVKLSGSCECIRQYQIVFLLVLFVVKNIFFFVWKEDELERGRGSMLPTQ